MQRLRPLSEDECYARCYGGRDATVRIVSLDGSVASSRACAGEAEARTYASTVNQHIHWLTAEKFREYYRLAGPDATGG